MYPLAPPTTTAARAALADLETLAGALLVSEAIARDQEQLEATKDAEASCLDAWIYAGLVNP